jgi:pimeloyl-ACP methyl ester carboxylesterase
MTDIVSARRREPAGWRGRRRAAASALCLLAGLSTLAGCAWLDVKQRTVMYRPTPGRPDAFAGLRPGDETSLIAVPGEVHGTTDKLAIWWLPPSDPAAPTLFYLHGTFRNLYRNYPKIEALRDTGFGVVAVDYRGWGDSTPIVPSEKTILADAEAAWAELVRRQPDARKRVIFGHSLGGAVAIDLASRRHRDVDYGALIVESTFPEPGGSCRVGGRTAGTDRRLALRRALRLVRQDRQDRCADPDAARRPGQHVPVALGRKLRDAAPPGVRWVEIAGGSHSRLHTDAPVIYRQELESLIGSLQAGR